MDFMYDFDVRLSCFIHTAPKKVLYLRQSGLLEGMYRIRKDFDLDGYGFHV